jgi:hypothetical protein
VVLIHIEIALEDPLLHGIGNLGLPRHLAGGRLHDGDTLGTLVTVCAQDWWGARHGTPFGSSTEVLREVVAFACEW